MEERRYAELIGPGVIRLRRETLSSILLPGYVRIKVAFCGICGSDISQFKGRPGTIYPLTLGHELCGEVVAIHEQVHGFEVGDLVSTDLNFRCGRCEFCLESMSHLCAENKVGRFSNRGFANYLEIDSRYLFKTDGFTIPYLPALAEPLSCALRSVELAPPRDGDNVLVLGCGGMGMMIAVGLRARHKDISFAVHDLATVRARQLQELLGDHLSVLEEECLIAGKFSLIFEASGALDGLRKACNLVRKGGRIAVTSHYDGQLGGDFIHSMLARKEVTVFFPYLNGEAHNFVEAIEILKTLSVTEKELSGVVEFYKLDDVAQAISGRDARPANKLLVRIF